MVLKAPSITDSSPIRIWIRFRNYRILIQTASIPFRGDVIKIDPSCICYCFLVHRSSMIFDVEKAYREVCESNLFVSKIHLRRVYHLRYPEIVAQRIALASSRLAS